MMTGVLLAGGASRRMGAPKPLVRDGGESFAAHGIRHLWTVCGTVVVVLGARGRAVRASIEREFEELVRSGKLHRDLEHAHRGGATGLEVRFVTNPEWRSGMFSSVTAGLRAALTGRPEALLVLPVDHPRVRPGTVADVAAVLHLALVACRTPRERRGFSYAVVPRHRGFRGHPIALTPALAQAIVKDRVAGNLSEAVKRSARLVGYLDVPDRGVVRNRNRPGD